jgi:hypothetical protein
MKLTNAQRKMAKWQPIADALERGEVPKFFINAQGNICIDDGNTGPVVPAWLAARFPAEAVAQAKAMQAQRAQEAAQRSRDLAAQLKAQNEARMASADLDRCILQAGENSAVVATGTYDHCMSMLPAVCRQPRDRYEGKGCWVLTAPHKTTGEPVELHSGYFDADMYW